MEASSLKTICQQFCTGLGSVDFHHLMFVLAGLPKEATPALASFHAIPSNPGDPLKNFANGGLPRPPHSGVPGPQVLSGGHFEVESSMHIIVNNEI